MPVGVCNRMHVAARAFRAWPIWGLPRWLAAFIVVITTVYAVALGVAARTVHVRPVGPVRVRRAHAVHRDHGRAHEAPGENAGVIKDVYAVWELPIAILLPPVFALVAPFPDRLDPMAGQADPLAPARVHGIGRRPVLRARLGSFRAIGHPWSPGSPSTWPATPTLRWPLAAGRRRRRRAPVGVNLALVLPAIKGCDPSMRMRDMIFDRERVHNDVAELSVAVLVTLGARSAWSRSSSRCRS